jgi:hypothetical protein
MFQLHVIGKTEKVMVGLIDEKPNATDEELVSAFYERLRDDEDYIQAALKYLAYKTLNNIRNIEKARRE